MCALASNESESQMHMTTRSKRYAALSLSGAIASLVLLGVLVTIGCSNEAAPSAAGEQASDFQITLFGSEGHEKGSSLSLSDLEGKPVVLNFWYPSCPPCRLEMPDLEAASMKHAANGVEFVGIQSLVLDTVEDGQQFIDEFGITYAVGPDSEGDILVDYDVSGFPTTIFLNEDHQVVRKWSGILDAEKLDELIAEVLN
jgi:peroxiredoxin